MTPQLSVWSELGSRPVSGCARCDWFVYTIQAVDQVWIALLPGGYTMADPH